MARLLAVLVFGAALAYGVVVLTGPWALHIGGRWTPLLYWSGSGKLTTGAMSRPFYLYLYPSSHLSHLRLDGLRPTGGVQGKAWLCTSPGVMQYLTMSGTIYGGWRSTEGSLIGLRLFEPNVINLGQRRGYFDLFGRWEGPQLVMTDRGHFSAMFRSGLPPWTMLVTLTSNPSALTRASSAAPGVIHDADPLMQINNANNFLQPVAFLLFRP